MNWKGVREMMNKQLQVSFGLAAKKLVTFGLCAGLFGLSLPCASYAAYGTEPKLKSELDPAPVSEPASDFIGFFDVGDCNVIAGWAADRNQSNTPIHVSIYDGPTLLTTVLANVSRPDVASTTGDNGLHGFNIPTPSILKNGLPHSVDVRFESTTTPLGTSPRSITCLTTPREDVGTGVLLAVDFKLNNGNASTSGRLVSLNFKATKVTGGTSEDITSQITHYRVRESDQQNAVADLSAQPWLPLE